MDTINIILFVIDIEIGENSYKYLLHFILFISVIQPFYWKEFERSLILDWTEEAH